MKIQSILTPSTMRHFPNTAFPTKRLTKIDAALNERFSFQLALRTDEYVYIKVAIAAPKGWEARVRRVGLVPVQHHNTPYVNDPLDMDGLGQIPGLVPDTLLEEDAISLGENENNAFWFTVKPNKSVKPGKYDITVTMTPHDWELKPIKKLTKTFKLPVELHNITIKPRKDFHVTHWFYADCLQTWYKTEFCEERFWELLPSYIKNITDHGQNVLYVPLFTPPLDMEKHPSQLLKITKKGKDKYVFDWTDVRRYVKIAKKCGIDTFEWCHLFSQWGCSNAIKIYEGQGVDEKLLWPKETPATDKIYRNFLSQLLPELQAFLKEEKILNKSLFHISDEPHGDVMKANYLAAKSLLRELAPWMRFIDAISELSYGKDGVVDMPVPTIKCAIDFHNAGIASWCYYCCSPRGKFLNHLMDTPLAKIAMHGFLFYHWPFKGFLHWGYNYWNDHHKRTLINPFVTTDANTWPGWAFGDTFLVYPGENGPIDSIRWEIFAEAMQDYALLQTLGIERDDKLFAKVKSFDDFPKDPAWRLKVRAELFKKL